jgi:hypothetical protein
MIIMKQSQQLPAYKDTVFSKSMLMPSIHTRAVAGFKNAQ